jgi:hypothetical protein
MKKYNKHYVKRDPGTGDVLKKGDKPVLGDIAKPGCPLETWHVNTLNSGWELSGIYFAEATEEPTKSDARLALEKEADELGVTYRDNIGDEKLQEKINKAIEA